MSMNCMDAAEEQFKSALQVSSSFSCTVWNHLKGVYFFQKLANNSDLATFINLNLAIVYLRTNRTEDWTNLLSAIDPERIPAQ